MPSNRTVLIRRLINAAVWIAIWAAAVKFTDSWGDWVDMGFQAVIPLMLAGYLHIILRGRDNPQ